MKRKYVIYMPLLLFLAISVLSLLSCSSNENDLTPPSGSNEECTITVKIGEVAQDINSRSTLMPTTEIIRQQIDNDLMVEAEVIKENNDISRDTKITPLASGTRLVAIVYRKRSPIVVDKICQPYVRDDGTVSMEVPSEDIIIDFYTLNTYSPTEVNDQLPTPGTKREDVKFLFDVAQSHPTFLQATVECDYPFNNLENVIFRSPFPQIRLQMTSQDVGLPCDFNANISNASSYKSATIYIKDGSVTNRSGESLIQFSKETSRDYEWYKLNPYVYKMQSSYMSVIPKETATSHLLTIDEATSDMSASYNLLKSPIEINLTKEQLPLEPASRYLISITLKRTSLPSVDVPYIQLEHFQIAKANLQYLSINAGWSVGNDPSYVSEFDKPKTYGGDDLFEWGAVYPTYLTAIVSCHPVSPEEWSQDHDPCTKLGSGWHIPTRQEWAQLIGDFSEPGRLEYDWYSGPPYYQFGLWINDSRGRIFLPTNGHTGYVENRKKYYTEMITGATTYYRLAEPEGEPIVDGDEMYAYTFMIDPGSILPAPAPAANNCHEELVDRKIGGPIRCVRSIPAP